MASKRPLILVTNDDGISAKGIMTLFNVVKGFGDVLVVSPDSPQSGMGHAITIHDPLRLYPSMLFEGAEAYACSGTPVDCVKLAINQVIKGKPDLLVSGINHGVNTATNVLYSGTMSAAVEGAMEDIPSIGFSLDSFDADADFSLCKMIIHKIVGKVLNEGLPKGVCLNVNIPLVEEERFQGVKVCRQAHAFWEDRFDKRYDQFNEPYYWLTGDFVDVDKSEDSDLYWFEKNYATVVPTKFDLTEYSAIKQLENWNL